MDTDRRADAAWILGVQRKLYQWSKAHPDEGWRDMWGWLTDPRTLRHAWRRVALNKGGRTAGIDGITVGRILWRDGHVEQHLLAWTSVCRYRYSWMDSPDFTMSSGELDA